MKTIFNYDIFAEDLRLHRESNNITTRKLAKDLDLTGATVSRIENFHIKPRLGTILKICDYFSLNVSHYFEEVGIYG